VPEERTTGVFDMENTHTGVKEMQNATDMKVEVEDLSQVKKKLNITLPADEVERQFNEAYRSLRSTAAVSGFRKGSVPLNIIKAKFGARVKEDLTARLIETSFPRAIKGRELVPVETPSIELKSDGVEEGKEFSYTATLEVHPKVEVDGYIGMEVKREPVAVSEADVEDALRRLAESKAEFRDVKSGIKDGDLVVVDYEASMDGELVKNGKAVDQTVIVGERTVLPGFDDALKGAFAGDRKEIRLTFPEHYSEKALAGREAVFSVTVKSVKEKAVPAVDDDFAKDLDFGGLDALRERVREDLTRVKAEREKEGVKNAILDRLLEAHRFEVPDSLVKRYLALILGRVVDGMRQGYFPPGDRGKNPDELKEKYTPQALRHVKEDVILDAIAAKENVDVSKEEFEAAVKKMADARHVSFDTLLARISREGAIEVVRDGIKHEKVFDIIMASMKGAV
jgi:trigger factor